MIKMKQLKAQDGYIDVMLLLTGVIVGIYLVMAFQEPIFKQFYTMYLADQVTKMVSEDGEISAETYTYIDDLTTSLGLSNYNPRYSFSGEISSKNHIQLRDDFKFRYDITVPIKVASPMLFESYTLDFQLGYTSDGKSMKYFRPGEY